MSERRTVRAARGRGPDPAHGIPGEVVGVAVQHHVNKNFTPVRPVVIVQRFIHARTGIETISAMGMTLHSHYQNGDPRIPIPDWGLIPLKGPGYLWGPKLVMFPPDEIRSHIGWAPPSLRRLICDYCDWGKKYPHETEEFLSTPPIPDGRVRGTWGSNQTARPPMERPGLIHNLKGRL